MMPTSAYDRWKTTDPNDGDQELYEKFYDEFWDDPELIHREMVQYFSDELEYLLFDKKQDPDPQENHWYTSFKKSFEDHALPYLLERMVEDFKYQYGD